MTPADRSRKCYAENPAYRERKRVQSAAWIKANSKRVAELLRMRRLAEKWIAA